jgi:hypothetical protein
MDKIQRQYHSVLERLMSEKSIKQNTIDQKQNTAQKNTRKQKPFSKKI